MAKVRERKWSKMMRPELGEVYFGGYPSLKGTGARTKGGKLSKGGGEVSPLRKGQQNYIDRLRAGKGGKTDTEGGGFSQKSSALKNQKREKIKKEGLTMEQESAKQAALRKKAEKQEALNQKDMERLYGKETEGGWMVTPPKVTPKNYHSKANIKKRKAEGYKPGKIRKKKKKEEEKSTPYHHEGGSGK